MYITKTIFSFDLRDFQYPFVLFDIPSNCWHYVSFNLETCVSCKYIIRREDRAKNCRNIRVIEQGKRYIMSFIFVFIYQNEYNQR